MCVYGYCRISTKQQSIDRQIRNIKGIELVFLKEPHINTSIYKKALESNIREN